MEQGTLSTTYSLTADTRPGDMVEFEVRLSNEHFELFSTTISKEYRLTEWFGDDMESDLSQWTTSADWGLTSTEAYSGNMSLTDSPNGLYGSTTATIQTAQPLGFE